MLAGKVLGNSPGHSLSRLNSQCEAYGFTRYILKFVGRVCKAQLRPFVTLLAMDQDDCQRCARRWTVITWIAMYSKVFRHTLFDKSWLQALSDGVLSDLGETAQKAAGVVLHGRVSVKDLSLKPEMGLPGSGQGDNRPLTIGFCKGLRAQAPATRKRPLEDDLEAGLQENGAAWLVLCWHCRSRFKTCHQKPQW